MALSSFIKPNPFGCVIPRWGLRKRTNERYDDAILLQSSSMGLFRVVVGTTFDDFIVRFPNPGESRSKTGREADFGFKSAGHALRTVEGQRFLDEDAPERRRGY